MSVSRRSKEGASGLTRGAFFAELLLRAGEGTARIAGGRGALRRRSRVREAEVHRAGAA